MVHTIIYGVLMFFVLVGVVASVYLMVLLFTRSKSLGHFIVAIPPMAKSSDIASLLCAARLRLGLLGDLVHSEVIALDCGMPEHARKQCEALCMELDHVALLTAQQFLEQMTKPLDDELP